MSCAIPTSTAAHRPTMPMNDAAGHFHGALPFRAHVGRTAAPLYRTRRETNRRRKRETVASTRPRSAYPASGRIALTGERIDETGEPQPSRWLSCSAGAGSRANLPDEEGAGPAGLPRPPPESASTAARAWPQCSGARCPTSRRGAACATPCTSSDGRSRPRPARFESKATPWPSTLPSSISTSRPSRGCLAKTPARRSSRP